MVNRPISDFVLAITVTAAPDDSRVIYFADDCDSILCAEVVLRNEVVNLSRMKLSGKVGVIWSCYNIRQLRKALLMQCVFLWTHSMTANLPRSRVECQLMVFVFSATCLYVFQADARRSVSPSTRLFGQKVIDDTLATHPDIQSLELATIPPGKTECITIASNEAMEIGEKCDRDELATLKTNEPFVKKEKEDGKELYQAILSIHDSTGSIIGVAGMISSPNLVKNEQR